MFRILISHTYAYPLRQGRHPRYQKIHATLDVFFCECSFFQYVSNIFENNFPNLCACIYGSSGMNWMKS